MITVLILAQFSNADAPMVSSAPSAAKLTVSIAVQFLNAHLPIVLMLATISTFLRAVPSNADTPIASTLAPSTKDSRAVQPTNALSPMKTTFSGTVTDLIFAQFSKADAPML